MNDKPCHHKSAPKKDHSSSLGALTQTHTCPMHPEIKQQGPGPCPICGMDLEPLMASDDQGELRTMMRRLIVSIVFSAPLVFISMLLMFPKFSGILDSRFRSFVELALAAPVCLWLAAPFYARAWQSLKS